MATEESETVFHEVAGTSESAARRVLNKAEDMVEDAVESVKSKARKSTEAHSRPITRAASVLTQQDLLSATNTTTFTRPPCNSEA